MKVLISIIILISIVIIGSIVRTVNDERTVQTLSAGKMGGGEGQYPLNAEVPEGVCRYFMVRHGETSWNKEGRLQGWSDIELSDIGREQLREAGELLSAELSGMEKPFDMLLTSDLKRCSESCEIIAAKLGYDLSTIVKDKRIREFDVGELSGHLVSELHDLYPEAWGAMRSLPLKPHHVFPGGESLFQRYTRAITAFEEVARANKGKRVLAVTHSGVLSDVTRRALDVSHTVAGPYLPRVNGAVHIVDVDFRQDATNPRFVIRRWGLLTDAQLTEKLIWSEAKENEIAQPEKESTKLLMSF